MIYAINLDNFLKGLTTSGICILIVFLVLALIILAVSILSKFHFKEDAKKVIAKPDTIKKLPSNKKLTIEDIKDEDMMVACLVATTCFVEETNEVDARLVSVKQIG